MNTDPIELQRVAERALDFVPNGGVIGLGTGRAATAFIHALAKKIHSGLRIRGVATSKASAQLAAELGIPLVTLEASPTLEVDFDGADEVDPAGNLVKGRGGALVREKVVATAARKLVILVGPEKIVPQLGSRSKLPVEVIPFATAPCARAIEALGLVPHLRRDEDQVHVTDNGNYILDCDAKPLEHPAELELSLRAIPGVVGTGLFLNMNPTVLIGHPDHVEVRGGA